MYASKVIAIVVISVVICVCLTQAFYISDNDLLNRNYRSEYENLLGKVISGQNEKRSTIENHPWTNVLRIPLGAREWRSMNFRRHQGPRWAPYFPDPNNYDYF